MGRIATHHDADGRELDARTAGVELLNVLRPTVAVARYVTFAALALHDHPEWRSRLAPAGGGPGAGDRLRPPAVVAQLRRMGSGDVRHGTTAPRRPGPAGHPRRRPRPLRRRPGRGAAPAEVAEPRHVHVRSAGAATGRASPSATASSADRSTSRPRWRPGTSMHRARVVDPVQLEERRVLVDVRPVGRGADGRRHGRGPSGATLQPQGQRNGQLSVHGRIRTLPNCSNARQGVLSPHRRPVGARRCPSSREGRVRTRRAGSCGARCPDARNRR
jgi:hypothetical protein